MKVKEAIKKADFLRPNAIDEELKAEWLVKFDGEMAEMMAVDVPELNWPEDQELLMPYPKDDIYPLYLMARIDLANEETALYQNDMIVANQAISEAKAWWYRNFGTHPAKFVRV